MIKTEFVWSIHEQSTNIKTKKYWIKYSLEWTIFNELVLKSILWFHQF